jgi:dipeptidyl aminopeptidase/acylaminoacyl peptidase
MTTIAPYGSWRSPITTDLVVQGTVNLMSVMLDGDDIYWLEGRPQEKGRYVLVRRAADGATRDVTPAPFNVRTRVHEYGGGSCLVADGVAYVSNFADQRLYRTDVGAGLVPAQPLTPAVDLRYADAALDRRRHKLFAVREDHTVTGEAVNAIVSVDIEGDERGGTVVVSGNTFYSHPRLSPDGARLAWLTWNHPNMPWDGTELWIADLDDAGNVVRAEKVAGGLDESICQPEWSPDGVLHFISDRTGWWNLYRWRNGQSEALCPLEAEFGEPQWVFGQSTYAFESAQRIVCKYNQHGKTCLATLDTQTLTLTPLQTLYTEIAQLRARKNQVVFIGGSAIKPGVIAQLDLVTGRCVELYRSRELTIDSAYLSVPQAIEFPTTNGLTAHAFYYPPTNRDYAAPIGARPPLIVESHGGPTSSTSTMFSMNKQYWTSRGFALVDVNYSGSAGYGTAYRRRLNGQWGIVDIDDCVNAARYLVAQGLADGNRLCIHGGSAGGYTTLAALTFRDTFKAGASYYGISDLEALAKETHKFESRYLDSMIGPYPARRDLYIARSPIHFTNKLNCPLILFQGLEDAVVPPNQAEMMFEAMKQKGIPVAYIPFAGEQHGFRQAKNIKRCLEAELYFYAKVFGFALADEVEPVQIENLP